MKSFICFSILLLFSIQDNQHEGNPRYDFPQLIITKNGTGFGRINGNLNDLSISGYYHESVQYEDTLMGPAQPVLLTLNHKKMQDAREFVLEEAKKYRILLINETHNRPQHRLFTKSLLEDLYKQGYNVFMAEGIELKNSLDSKAYPISSDGYLVNEPSYASLIRYAGRIGYKVRAYEYNGGKGDNKYWDDSVKLDKYGSIKYISYKPKDSMILLFDEKGLKNTILTSVREQAQADNILKIIKENPTAKFVIHVGLGHLYESGPWMGAKLRALLNYEDVLTIDQVAFNERISIIDTITNDTIKRSFPYVLLDSSTKRFVNFSKVSQVDYTLFNAEVKDSLLRPNFLFNDVEKREVHRLSTNQLSDCPCVCSAYYPKEYAKEGSNAIAIDVIYVKNEQSIPPFLLYKDKYMVVKKNKEGKYTNFKLEIK